MQSIDGPEVFGSDPILGSDKSIEVFLSSEKSTPTTPNLQPFPMIGDGIGTGVVGDLSDIPPLTSEDMFASSHREPEVPKEVSKDKERGTTKRRGGTAKTVRKRGRAAGKSEDNLLMNGRSVYLQRPESHPPGSVPMLDKISVYSNSVDMMNSTYRQSMPNHQPAYNNGNSVYSSQMQSSSVHYPQLIASRPPLMSLLPQGLASVQQMNSNYKQINPTIPMRTLPVNRGHLQRVQSYQDRPVHMEVQTSQEQMQNVESESQRFRSSSYYGTESEGVGLPDPKPESGSFSAGINQMGNQDSPSQLHPGQQESIDLNNYVPVSRNDTTMRQESGMVMGYRQVQRMGRGQQRDNQVLLHVVGSLEPFGVVIVDARTDRLDFVRKAIEKHFQDVIHMSVFEFLSRDGVPIRRSQEKEVLVWSQTYEKVGMNRVELGLAMETSYIW